MPTTMVSYPVADDSLVSLDVFVGEGQPGGSSVVLGQDPLAAGDTEMRDVRVGLGAELRGRKLVVVTATENRSPFTDRTSSTIDLRGGPRPKSITQQQTSGKKGEVVTYVTVVSFITE